MCMDCGQELESSQSICPNCESDRRKIEINYREQIEFHEQIKHKEKRKGTKKPLRESKIGDDYHSKTGKWNHREMHVDRENDDYEETITDKETGKIIHHCKEPLSKHRGHGSAKK